MPAPSRRAMIGALAAAPVAGLPMIAVAASPSCPALAAGSEDPIYAAIERHKQTYKAFEEVCHLTDECLPRQQGRVVTEADQATWGAAEAADDAAMEALIATAPTTPQGVLAALTYLAKRHRRGHELGDEFAAFADTLAASPAFAA